MLNPDAQFRKHHDAIIKEKGHRPKNIVSLVQRRILAENNKPKWSFLTDRLVLLLASDVNVQVGRLMVKNATFRVVIAEIVPVILKRENDYDALDRQEYKQHKQRILNKIFTEIR